jgi:hypothetical protein
VELRRLLTTLADVDTDGDLDALGSGAWFENYDGRGNFAIHRLTSDLELDYVAGDIDGDGDLDLVTSEPKWYTNTSGRGDFDEGQLLPDSNMLSGSIVHLTDTGNDGDLDVVLLTDDEVAHYENRDGQLVAVERIERPAGAAAADIDGDGDLDLTFVDQDTVDGYRVARVWLRINEGGQQFEDQLLVSEAAANEHDNFPTNTGLLDIDSDGWTDLVVHRVSPDFPSFTWTWYRNQTGSVSLADGGTVVVTTYMANIIGIFDVDGDGDVDGVAEEPVGPPVVIWFENDGAGQFAPYRTLCECGFDGWPTAGGDLNGDQVPDVLLATLAEGVPMWIDGATDQRHQNVVATRELVAGDANADFRFDEADLILVGQAAKFASGQPASWSQGDWNGAPGGTPEFPPIGDGQFDQLDLDAAMTTGLYRLGQYNPTDDPPTSQLEPLGIERARHEVVVSYQSSTGDVAITTSGFHLTSIQLTSQQAQFSQPTTAFDGPFDVSNPTDLFQFDPSGNLIMEFGPVLPPELPWDVLLGDLLISGSRLGGGGLGSVRLDCLGCAVDVDSLQAAILSGSNDPRFDLDINQRVDTDDVRRLINELLRTEFGDANLDGQFTTRDLVEIFQAGEYEDGVPMNSTWSQGDWDTDGDFTNSDLVLAMQTGGYELEAPPQFAGSKPLASFEIHEVLRGLDSVDLDGDADLDIVIGAYDAQNVGQGSRVDWYENTDGMGTLGPARPITRQLARVSSISVGDLDNDGDADVVASSIDDDTIAWIENTDGQANFGPVQVISSSADFALCVLADDLDGDGDLDVLSTSLFDHRIVWYENVDGAGRFGTPHTVRTGQRGDYEYLVRTGDIDGDGDVDAISANGNSVTWIANEDGQGTFGPQQIITQPNDYILIVHTADLDGDGDLDVLTGGEGNQRVSWFENLDGRGTFGHETVLTNEALDVRSILTADLDNDGDVDILSNTFYGRLAWYENLDGAARFGPPRLLSTRSFSGVLDVVDFDSDGDMDVLAPEFDSPTLADIVWYENQTVVAPG